MIPYEEYKDSGIEWIGKIPKDWEVVKLKRLGSISTSSIDKKFNDNEKIINLVNYMDVYKNNFISSKLNFSKTSAKETQIVKNQIKKGDLLITPSSETSNDIGHSAVVLEEIENTVYSYHLVRLSFRKELDLYFKKYLLNNHFVFNQLSSLATGTTRMTLGLNDFNYVDLILPRKEEQNNIALFLDKKTSLIDSAIEKKTQLIELLKEQRQAIINNAVTKGINSNVEMKESGIDWIGEIPKHWEIKKLKYLLLNKLSYGINDSSEDDNISDPRFIRITDFGYDGKLRNDTFKSLPYEKAKEYLLKEGDILFARSGATVGKTFQFRNYQGNACYAGYLILARANVEKILQDYLYYFTKSNSYSTWCDCIFIKATIQNISAEKYANLKLAAPPIKEQQEIVDFLNKETERIDKSVKKIQREIELLKEYKEALISEVVTGKVNVQGAKL